MASVLTSLQSRVLRLFFEAGAAHKGYFFTGGSALSEYYFQHRISDDLDFFSRSERNVALDSADFQQYLESQGIEARPGTSGTSFSRFFVSDEMGGPLKIDLARDDVELAPIKVVDGVRVDSLEDIAVNKVCALSRQEPKDYVDLYFILTESFWTLDYLLQRASLKDGAFDDPRGHLQFAHHLSLAGSLTLPQFMLKPLDQNEMRNRLTGEAEKIFARYAPGLPG